MSCPTPGSTIHFTTNGTLPDENSPEYTQPIQVGYSQTIKAVAVKEDYNNSIITVCPFTINNGNQQLVVFPRGGDYELFPLQVYPRTNIENGVIRYTLDGSTPTDNSLLCEDFVRLQNYGVSIEFKAAVFLNGAIQAFATEIYNPVTQNNLVKSYFRQIDNENESKGDFDIWSDELSDWMDFSSGNLYAELPENINYTYRSLTGIYPGTSEKFYRMETSDGN